MAKLNFPPINDADSDPINGFVWTDPNGQAWRFDSTIPAWKPLQPGESAVTFIGSIDLTIAPSSQYVSIEPGNQFVVSVGSTSVNGIFYPGLAGENVPAGTTVFYDGVEWHTLLVSIPYTYPGGVERTVDNRLTDYVSVKDFGAVGDGVTDDTAAIQAAVNAVQGTDATLRFPKGSYLLTAQTNINQDAFGTSTPVAVVITDSINVDATAATFPVDISDSARKHSFAFDGVSAGTWKGGTFVGFNTTVTTRLPLFSSCAVAINKSTGVTVSDVVCQDLKASVQMYWCESCVIKDCLGYRVDTTIQSGTFFGGYAGSFNLIEGCRTFGGCEDGDIYHYGTGYGNSIKNCQMFNSLYGDETYAIIDGNNQGCGLDADQDSGTIDGCTAYGHYYAIEVKGNCGQSKVVNNTAVRNKVGITVRAGEVNQDVSGHTLIANNTVIPADGNGNDNNLFGYLVTGIELSRFPSVTIDGNFIGVKESKFLTAGTPDVLNFASILAVNDADSLEQNLQTCDIIISNNNITHTTQYGGLGNQSYNTGPAIFVRGYWSGENTNNKADAISLNISGNVFNPYAANIGDELLTPDVGVVSIDGVYSVIYSNNTHTGVANVNEYAIPFVSTTNVAKMLAANNVFDRQSTAFIHSFPVGLDIQWTIGFIASNNIFGRGLTTTGVGGYRPVISVSGDGPCLVTGNTYWRVEHDPNSVLNEGPLVEYNYTNSGALMLTNNCINSHHTSTSYYSVNGVDGATGSEIKVDDIVVNLPIPPVP